VVIIEQIEMIQEIIQNGFAYEANGSVYFDVKAYSQKHDYGKLSGRVLEDLIAGAGNEARTLEGQEEKRNPNDFALWKKASAEHIMQWNSPWGKGFPGWHIECSAMSKKYLGETFDIHGGGMDLLFPHHESEVAQSMACTGHQPANYWMHHNMITVNGQKMAKSLNNGISIDEFFSGKNPLLEKAYSPMTLKFFILQAHYRGTLDFSNAALQASEKGLSRLLEGVQTAARLKPSDRSSFEVEPLVEACYEALNEDLNTPILIAALFELLNQINLLAFDKATLTEADLNSLKSAYSLFLSDILGLEANQSQSSEKTTDLIQMLIQLRQEAKAQKNYALSDQIRIQLSEIGIELKDSKEGTHFTIH